MLKSTKGRIFANAEIEELKNKDKENEDKIKDSGIYQPRSQGLSSSGGAREALPGNEVGGYTYCQHDLVLK